MDVIAFEALFTPLGQALLAEARDADISETALIRVASDLRRRYPPDLVASALTQVRLRARAAAKFGPDAGRMYFTPAGLEQSTRTSVAAHRARRFAALKGPVLDLCCGIGGDLVELARAAVEVVGIDRDPLTVAVANANLAALGLAERAMARVGEAVGRDPSRYAAVFADPGRRSAGRGRIFDPRAYEPPLDTLLEIAAGAGCVKVAPGIPYAAIPDGAEAEWVSDGGEVKEAALWLGGLAGDVRRRATLLPSGASLVAEAGLGEASVGGWRRFVYEPDGAVIRAHLVAEVAALLDGTLVDRHIAYITSDRFVETPFARAFEIEDVQPFSVKRLRAEVRRRRAGILTIKKRGSAVDVERLRRDLRPEGPEALTVVLTRVGAAPVAVLCHPVDQPDQPAGPPAGQRTDRPAGQRTDRPADQPADRPAAEQVDQ